MTDTIASLIDKWTKLYQRGIITAGEFLCSFVNALAEQNDFENVTDYLPRLPHEITARLSHFLTEVCAKDYRWRIFRIGPVLTGPELEAAIEAEFARNQRALRRMDEILFPVVHAK